MKILYEREKYKVYQCEKCGCRQKIYGNKVPESCIAVDCENYGYGKDEGNSKLVELREKYIGKRIKDESEFIIADFLDLETVVLLDIAGFYPVVLEVSELKLED